MDTSRLSAAENLLAQITGTGNAIELPTVDQLTAEIKVLTRQTVANFVEIGTKLIQVKQQLPHGEWGNWVENEVKFKYTKLHPISLANTRKGRSVTPAIGAKITAGSAIVTVPICIQ
jgi:hypothetical protein